MDTAQFTSADLRRVKDRADLRTLAAAFVPGMKRDGPAKMKGRCPFHAEKTASFYAWRDHYHCFGCGAHGGPVDFLMQSERLDFADAVRALASRLGVALSGATPPARPAASRPPERPAGGSSGGNAAPREREPDVLPIWKAGEPVRPGCPVWCYLQGRGLDEYLLLPWLGSLRCQPAHPYWHEGRLLGRHPAMLALIQDHEGRPIGLHQTYLAFDGGRGGWSKLKLYDAAVSHPPAASGSEREAAGQERMLLPSKKVLGRVQGGAIRFGLPAPHLIGGEGIETALSELEARLARGIPGCGESWSVWALVSLMNFAGPGATEKKPRLHPDHAKRDQRGRRRTLPSPVPGEGAAFKAPAGTRRFTWIADSDAKDPAAAEMLLARGTARLTAAGIACGVIRAAAGMDRNDELKAIKGAAPPRDPAASRASGPASGCLGGDAAPVSGSLQ